MTSLRLRRLSRSETAWRLILAGWRDRGIVTQFGPPAVASRHLAVSADNGAWRGRLDPRQWLAGVYPELAALADSARDEESILALFNSQDRPLSFAHPGLPYKALKAEGLTPGDDITTPLPCLAARECPVWLTGVSDALALLPNTPVRGLLAVTLPVEWLIGSSRLPAGMAAKLSPGDVLLINRPCRRVRSQGVTIGIFRHNEEKIMTDEYHQDDPAADGAFTAMPDVDPISAALREVPLKVEFILQRRFLSIGELQQLYAGKVLELEPGVEKRIEIRANGRLLARGELVQLEDRLGVEVSDLYLDQAHDQ
ncbi:type III secretion system cytoplasmic ring protein SctQ [Martelella alba]|uniref:type III secretion system cytoplasmic ring protein SctQ n=1 Tax=Martelella alba TaxID=2590451 RepID=UPI0014859CBC|nr:type III secretion system cytoplasmic ring protein SctQ [Martelella alba]